MTEATQQEVFVSRRQIEVVQLLANGLSMREIAKKTHQSLQTVENQVFDLRRELNCTTIVHLVAAFFRSGLIE
jgi:DNA-binding NarL/FixJ family response regulator